MKEHQGQQVSPPTCSGRNENSHASTSGGAIVVDRSHDNPSAASEDAGWRLRKGLATYSRQAKNKHNSGR